MLVNTNNSIGIRYNKSACIFTTAGSIQLRFNVTMLLIIKIIFKNWDNSTLVNDLVTGQKHEHT